MRYTCTHTHEVHVAYIYSNTVTTLTHLTVCQLMLCVHTSSATRGGIGLHVCVFTYVYLQCTMYMYMYTGLELTTGNLYNLSIS